jgi:predicted flap endonuclease-1-like 5' DNA nuclease
VSDPDTPFRLPPGFEPGELRVDLLRERLQPDRIVKVGDEVGVFVPFTKGDGTDPGSVTNLQQLVDVLKDQMVRLQQDNERLTAALAAVDERPRNPDDLGAALASSLDTLQARLADVQNARTEFAVREFEIDAAVWVDVNALGGLEYRFPSPSARLDPSSLSRVKLSLVATPKQVEPGAEPTSTGIDPRIFDVDVGIDEVYGIGEEYRRKLNGRGVFTAVDFLRAATRARVAGELEGLLDVDRATLVTWASQAELITIPGIHGRQAHVLVSMGVTGLADLADRDPATLPDEIAAAAKKLRGLGRVPPVTTEQASAWVSAARARRRL